MALIEDEVESLFYPVNRMALAFSCIYYTIKMSINALYIANIIYFIDLFNTRFLRNRESFKKKFQLLRAYF